MTPNRNGNRWNINELIALQRECELLEMSIAEIAEKHERTQEAILFKIEQEGFTLVTKKDKKDLNKRVNNLESSFTQMKGMVKQVVTHFMETRRKKQMKKLQPLRKNVSASS